MNELRWILLGIGVVIIAIIYFLGTRKSRLDIRSRVENFPGLDRNSLSTVKLKTDSEKLIDISGALSAFNAYLRQARESTDPVKARLHEGEELPDEDAGVADTADARETEPAGRVQKEQEIIVIYITARTASVFKGDEIQQVLDSANMQFGEMDIFHHYGPDKNYSTRALFSLANIHEPGTFDIENMETFSTDGLAMFMCLPAEIGGDIAMEIMLDTARNIGYLLDGDLRGSDRQLLTEEKINKLREKAGRY